MEELYETDRHAVKLSVFEGPLELLLHLLKKNKVSIYEIPIVEITKQYFEYMETCKEFDIEYSSEFIVMAAEIFYIKSKMLLPKREEAEEEDPRADLAKRLLEYQKMKLISELLKTKEFSDFHNFYKRPEPLPKLAPDYSDQRFDIDRLWQAFLTVLDKKERKEPPSKTAFGGIVGRETVSVKSRADFIQERLKRKKRVPFASLFNGIDSRPAVIATFLALLEMIKLEIIQANGIGGELYIEQLKEGDIVDEY